MKFRTKEGKGITLIALVITIIVLLILAAVSIAALTGDNGIITQARWASFVTEMTEVAEKVDIATTGKATELYLSGETESFNQDISATLFTQKYSEEELSDTLKREVEFLEGDISNLYLIELDNVKKNTYLYEPTIKVVFKIKGINIFGTTIHSIEYGSKIANKEQDESKTSIIEMKPACTKGYYEPNLDGFDAKNTYIVYYSKDYTQTKQITAEEYMSQGRPQTLDGGAYTFYNYIDTSSVQNTSTWGNVKTYANGQEAWWVWIPRYSYNTTTISSSTGFEIKFTTVENKVLDLEGKELGTVGEGDYADYISHSGFTEKYTDSDGNIQKVKELTGIWMSKYEPSTSTVDNPNETVCYAPNLEGYDINNTYIVTYNKDGTSEMHRYLLANVLKGGYEATDAGSLISGTVDMSKIPADEVWYDYGNQIWGNVVTIANGQEAWWVWIPRYSYSIDGPATGFSVVFVDVNDKPFSGQENDPLGVYQVHSGFNLKDGTKLKGIWMSKYEPSTSTVDNPNETICYAPNLEGYDINNTYIVTYNKDGTAEMNRYLLANVLNSGYKATDAGSLISGTVDMSKIPADEVWYDYGNQIWGNVVTMAHGQEAWWVWIPRYSYSIDGPATGFSVVFVDVNDKPFSGQENDPLGVYQVHSGFNLKDGTKLKGIWMSKYEPSGEPSSADLVAPTISE